MRTAMIIAAVLAPLAASAEELRLTAYEVALDPERYGGQRITVTGCKVWGANLKWAYCRVNSDTGNVGDMRIDTAGMAVTDRRTITTECAGLTPTPNCTVAFSAVIGRKGDDIWLAQPAIVRD